MDKLLPDQDFTLEAAVVGVEIIGETEETEEEAANVETTKTEITTKMIVAPIRTKTTRTADQPTSFRNLLPTLNFKMMFLCKLSISFSMYIQKSN